MKGVLHTDGGARGNPGPAAIGVVLEFPDIERAAVEVSEVIGETTNNVAEYRALLRGMDLARAAGVTELFCRLDSELVVKQLTGDYRVKDARLAGLVQRVAAASRSFRQVSYTAVPRAKNRRADGLVNRALDRR